jgi:hypothetical protein
MLNTDLLNHGFIKSKADQCIYFRQSNQGLIIISVHVDDMLVACPSLKDKQWFENTFMTKYELTGQHETLSYIGMSIRRSKTEIVVNQLGYIENMTLKYLPSNFNHYPSVPASPTLLRPKDQKTPISSTKYLSIVMTLMYLARHTRPDILMPVTFLATKSAEPTAQYYSDAIRIVAYVESTKGISMIFSSSADLLPVVYADASHLLHQDAKGHGGIILSLGSAPIMTKSYKLKINSKSSTESELVVLESACSYANWWFTLLKELNIMSTESIKIYQDNMSAIAMVKNSNFSNLNKHMVNRVNIIKEELTVGTITVEHLPTKIMVADILTKVCDKNTLFKLMSLMRFRNEKDNDR